ncbi:MAG: HupE/UreJ family protein, partial [Acidobacteria bacterium]|nr:HupE/UreJ family protein [Acidobacteriota bacterium]
MAWSAEEGKVVDVGGAPVGCVVGDEVVCFAAPVVGAAEHTSSVSSCEGEELGWRGGADGLAEPERLCVDIEHRTDEFGVAPVLFEYPIENDAARFSIDPKLARLGIRTTTVVRFAAPDKPERVYQFSGDPGLVNLDPSFFQAVYRFVELGFFHILDGLDHLLFLLCLVVPIRNFRKLVPIVTSFTVAHSITLFASAFALAPSSLWFP